MQYKSQKFFHKCFYYIIECKNSISAQVLPCFIIKLSEKCQKQTVAHIDIQGAYASSIAKASKEHESPDEKLQRVKKRVNFWIKKCKKLLKSVKNSYKV